MLRISFASLSIVTVLTACGAPNNTEVADAFKKAHPIFTIINIGVGEGDGSAAYFHIKYTKPADTQIHEDAWHYIKAGDGSWTLKHKATLK